MIDIIKKKDCCGCSACYEICPKKCIEFEVDEEGFLYPKINKNICINCGMCNKVCPLINDKYENKHECKAYVAYVNSDHIRLKSSSGGLFTVFSNYILKNKGIVIGAAFDEDFSVKHIAIENKDDLYKLQGSKYLQSRMENMYSITQSYLNEGRLVLFTGTACQVAGLKNFLRKDYNNLFTIDVLCHGVPSPKVWEKYLNEKYKEYKSKLYSIFFREKKFGWKNYALSLHFRNGNYLMKHDDDSFFKLFLSEICLRPSCYDCHYKEFPRPSDLTMGDAWGIENHMPEMDDDKGTSVLITNSEKGNKLLSIIMDQLIIKEAQLDVVLPLNADSRKSVKPHKKRELFFDELDNKSIVDLVALTNVSFLKKVLGKIKSILKKIIKVFFK